jgi:CubicO group peptidase (beta-lactamase class C family)
MQRPDHSPASLRLSPVPAGVSANGVSALPRRDEIETVSESIDRYVSGRMRAARIPGLALAVVRGDRIAYLKGYGRADPSGRAVTPQTPFIIGSITKAFTALAVMQLVEDGKVELDAPVQRYIPWFRVADPQASAQITVRHLLYMTSGIPQNATLPTWDWPNEDGVLERHVRLLGNVALSRPPGNSFGYSNADYVTLAVIVQVVSGLTYEEYVRQHIFAPLDMRHSFATEDEAMQDGMAMGYRWWFGFPVAAHLPFVRSNLPAGFLMSCAEDMAHFLIAQMNGGRYQGQSVLSPEGIALTHIEPIPGTYAMGWENDTLNGRKLINHDGGTANFQASVFFDPEARVGVFVAANVMSALDAFSSPHGSTPVDGITTRAMGKSVLSLATNRPLPEQGLRNERLYLAYDFALLAFTAALVRSLAQIPARHRRLEQRGISGRSDLLRRTGEAALSHLLWPSLLPVIARLVPAWKMFVLFQPDLRYWLKAAGTVVFLKGLLEIALAWRVFKQTSRT